MSKRARIRTTEDELTLFTEKGHRITSLRREDMSPESVSRAYGALDEAYEANHIGMGTYIQFNRIIGRATGYERQITENLDHVTNLKAYKEEVQRMKVTSNKQRARKEESIAMLEVQKQTIESTKDLISKLAA